MDQMKHFEAFSSAGFSIQAFIYLSPRPGGGHPEISGGEALYALSYLQFWYFTLTECKIIWLDLDMKIGILFVW